MTKLQAIKRDIKKFVTTIEKAEKEGIKHVNWGRYDWGSIEEKCGCLFGAATIVLDNRQPETPSVERTARKYFPVLCKKADWNWWDIYYDCESRPIFNILGEISEELDRADLYAFFKSTPAAAWLEWIQK